MCKGSSFRRPARVAAPYARALRNKLCSAEHGVLDASALRLGTMGTKAMFGVPLRSGTFLSQGAVQQAIRVPPLGMFLGWQRATQASSHADIMMRFRVVADGIRSNCPAQLAQSAKIGPA